MQLVSKGLKVNKEFRKFRDQKETSVHLDLLVLQVQIEKMQTRLPKPVPSINRIPIGAMMVMSIPLRFKPKANTTNVPLMSSLISLKKMVTNS